MSIKLYIPIKAPKGKIQVQYSDWQKFDFDPGIAEFAFD